MTSVAISNDLCEVNGASPWKVCVIKYIKGLYVLCELIGIVRYLLLWGIKIRITVIYTAEL